MLSKRVALCFVCLVLSLSTSASGGAHKLFGIAHEYTSGGSDADSVAAADVNGDGKLDLLVANQCIDHDNCNEGGVVGVLLGNGDGTFQAVQTYNSGGSYAISIAVRDVNGDGKPDLLVANACGRNCLNSKGRVGVLLGNGDGTFQTAQSYSSGGYSPGAIAVGDVNGDGKPDLVVANFCGSDPSCHTGLVGVLLGKGDGTFKRAKTYDSGGYGTGSVAVADVNRDRKLDLVVADVCPIDNLNCQNGGVAGVLLGNGDGTFQAAQTYNSGGTLALSIAVGDVNGDQKPDLLVANSCATGSDCNGAAGDGVVGVLLGNGDGTFQKARRYDSGGFEPEAVAIRDVNGDGKPDLLVANRFTNGPHFDPDGVLALHLGNGDGTFQKAQRYRSGGDSRFVAVGDVNGDGKPDLLVANACILGVDCRQGGGVGVLLAQHLTTTSLGSTPNPSLYGQEVTLTATVSSDGPSAPTGTVTFRNGTKWLGMVTLGAGVATLSTAKLPVGTLSITARYNGDMLFVKSTSPALIQVVE